MSVLLLAIIVVFLLPLISSITYKESIYRALIFLVISCPCAIVISVPLSYFSGIGKASKFGILIKGSNYLDSLKNLKTIVFDKTGTLTKGEFGVEKIKSINKYSDDELLEYAALGEINSNHPIAIAILKEYKMRKNIAEENDRETIKNSEQVNLKYQNEQLNNIIIDNKKITQFQEIAGKGLLYKIDDKTIKVGNNEFVDLNKQEYKKMCKNEIGTIIFVKIDDEIIGYIVLNDSIKPESKNIISKLKNLGIKTMMFTGDNKDIAEKVGNKIEINEIKYEMLPTDKYKEMEKLISRRSENERIAFVGDGINDSPVLALSDIGISMGGIGASSAIEASDIVIMTDDLNKIEEAINISKVTNMIIKQNLIFAMSIKVLVLLLSVIGIAQMWMAVFADVGVTLLTILNTIRILKK